MIINELSCFIYNIITILMKLSENISKMMN
jgi:hypothetical protein